MAWRHGYGEMSTYYVDRYNAGQSVNEELPGYDEWKTRSPYENEPSEIEWSNALEHAEDSMDRYLAKEGSAYLDELKSGQLDPEDIEATISNLMDDLVGVGQSEVSDVLPGIDLQQELGSLAKEKLDSFGIVKKENADLNVNLENAGFMDADEALRIKRIQDLAGIKDAHPWSNPVEEAGVGILTPQNTTADVKKGTLKNQGQKLGFDINDDGMPPRISKNSGIKKN